MKVGFIGLGQVGGKLAGSLLRNGVSLTVRDLDKNAARGLLDGGARWGESAAEMGEACDVVITCLPSPEVSALVVEGEGGLIEGVTPGTIWAEMSSTEHGEVKRLAAKLAAVGVRSMDCPVSGGCHRAATGNISIFAGGDRETFDLMFPLLTKMGRRILHTGDLGSASVLKIVTNYLASVHLVSLCEAFMVARASGMDMGVTYEAVRVSSGNSFVHETEGQVILNGSRDINFTMDLVLKDMGIFGGLAREFGVPVEVSPVVYGIFRDGMERYGARGNSPDVVRRLEEACGLDVRADGFPAEIVDDEPEEEGYEVVVADRSN
ncbi:MAG: NAD(P)-dependent oxidoreductase [Alphaproteobacteria bacterium]|nr:NAD(P)-dependent oxidoreductase [Alphaproteobacteria bacterium]